jgi:hypothetical protein
LCWWRFSHEEGICNPSKGNLTYLRSLGKKPGQVATLPLEEKQFVFYLVTKESSYDKPTLIDLQNSLLELRDLCNGLGVNRLSMPKIASGRDHIPWRKVQWILRSEFVGTGIEIDVYTLPQNNETGNVNERQTPITRNKSSSPSNQDKSSYTPTGKSTRETETPAITRDSPRRQTSSAASPVDVPYCTGGSLDSTEKGESASIERGTSRSRVSVAVNVPYLRQSSSHHRTAAAPTREIEAPAITKDSPCRQTSSAASPVDVPYYTGGSLDSTGRGESTPVENGTSASRVSVAVDALDLSKSTSHHCIAATPTRETEAPAMNGDSPRRQTSSAASPVDAPPRVGGSSVDQKEGESVHSESLLTGTKVPAEVTCSNSRLNTCGTPMLTRTRSQTRKSTISSTSATTPPDLLQPTLPTHTRSCGVIPRFIKQSKIPVPVIPIRAVYQSSQTDKHVPEFKGKLRSHDKKQTKVTSNFQIAKVRKNVT